MTVLQFGSDEALSLDASLHIPAIVITGASEGTLDGSGCLVSAGSLMGAGDDCGAAAGGAAGLAAWPQAKPPSSRQTNPRWVIFRSPPGEIEKVVHEILAQSHC